MILRCAFSETLLLPLTNASYRSMAKMRAVAPKLEMLKKQHQYGTQILIGKFIRRLSQNI